MQERKLERGQNEQRKLERAEQSRKAEREPRGGPRAIHPASGQAQAVAPIEKHSDAARSFPSTKFSSTLANPEIACAPTIEHGTAHPARAAKMR